MMKYVRHTLVGISCILFLYLLLFTDASFSGNTALWSVLLAISVAVFGYDYYRYRKTRR